MISRGSWRVLYYYRIFSITTRRSLLLSILNDDNNNHPSPCRSRQPCIVLARTVLTSVPLRVESLPVSFTAAELLATIVRSTVSRDRPHLIRSPPIDDTAPIQATAGVRRRVHHWPRLYSSVPLSVESLPVSSTAVESSSYAVQC